MIDSPCSYLLAGIYAHALMKHLFLALLLASSAFAAKPETRSFPFTSVQYRIEDAKTDFIVALFRTLEYTMKNNTK